MSIQFHLLHLNPKIFHLNGYIIHNFQIFVVKCLYLLEEVGNYEHSQAVYKHDVERNWLLAKADFGHWDGDKTIMTACYDYVLVVHQPLFDSLETLFWNYVLQVEQDWVDLALVEALAVLGEDILEVVVEV